MKIIVLAQRRPDVAPEQMRPYFQAEVQAIWDLYAQDVVREFYTRGDQGGPAILTVEAENVEAAREALKKLPLVEVNMLDLEFIPLAPFNYLTHLFEGERVAAGH